MVAVDRHGDVPLECRVAAFAQGDKMDDPIAMFLNDVFTVPASLAGLPGRARQVGYALHAMPEDSTIPWHRVVNARGEIRLALDSPAGRAQRLQQQYRALQETDVESGTTETVFTFPPEYQRIRGNQSFDEIAYQVGYEDTGFFRKVFVQLTGLRPKEYQRKFTMLH